MMKHNPTRRQFLKTSAGIAGLTLAGCSTGTGVLSKASGPASEVATLRIANPSKCTILQLTDVHYFWGDPERIDELNKRTEEDIIKLVALTKPDLIMLTGDLWRDRFEERREEFMRYGIAKCAALGVPWAYTWGNHDQLNDFAVGHKALTEAPNALYRGSASEGNYCVDLVDRHDKTVCQLICLNSERKGLGAAQQEWMRRLAEKTGSPKVPRLAFFHIPIKQYGDIWTAGTATGFKAEDPCIEEENGSSLPYLKALGVKACFCGHDHVNDYSGLIDGIELVYGRATGYGGYGQEDLPKGGKLITVDCLSGQYSWETILPDGTRWKPKPGERVNIIKKT